MENSSSNMVDLMSITMQKIRDMVDVNTIIGTPIATEHGTIIPVSKVTFGFTSGGADFNNKDTKPGIMFGGGAGAGVSITPTAFLFANKDGVKLIHITPPSGNSVDRIVDLVPEVIEKISGLFKKEEDDTDK